MSGLPDVEEIRSVSKFGLSVGDGRLPGGHGHLPGAPAGRRAAHRRPEAIPEGYGEPGDGAHRHGPRRDLPVRGPRASRRALRARRTRVLVAHGAPHVLDWFVAYQLQSVSRASSRSTPSAASSRPTRCRSTRERSWRLPLLARPSCSRRSQHNNRNVGGGYLVRNRRAGRDPRRGARHGPRGHRPGRRARTSETGRRSTSATWRRCSSPPWSARAWSPATAGARRWSASS